MGWKGVRGAVDNHELCVNISPGWPVTNKLSLLVVDDDPSIRRLFTELVGSQPGIEVETTSNGSEGLKRVSEGGFHIAVVDLNMPVMGGMDFLEKVKNLDPLLDVVMLTGHGTIESADPIEKSIFSVASPSPASSSQPSLSFS